MKSSTHTPSPMKSNIGIIFLVIFIDIMGFSMIFPLFPEMLAYYLPDALAPESFLGTSVAFLESLRGGNEEGGFLMTVIFGGFLGSLYALMQFVFNPLWGRLSDKLGRRAVLLMTLSGTALSYVLWIFSRSFGLFLISRLASGIMAGNLSVATAAVADVTTRKERSKGMAFVGVAFGLGFLLGPAIGGFASVINLLEVSPSLAAYGLHPFSFPACIALSLALVNLLWAFFKFKETHPVEKRAEQVQRSLYPFKHIFAFQNSDVRQVNRVYWFFMLIISGLEFTMPFVVADRFAYTPGQIGQMFIFLGFVLIFTQGFLVRKLIPRCGEKKVALLGLFFGVLGFTGVALAEVTPFFYVSLSFFAMGLGMVSVCLSALISLYTDENNQGYALGVFRSAGSLARACGPFLAAALYFCWGATTAYMLGAAVLLLPLALAFSFPKPELQE